MDNLFSSPEFEAKFTYTGKDLGSVWTSEYTTFRLWAPTADEAQVLLYRSGDPDAQDLLEKLVKLLEQNLRKMK